MRSLALALAAALALGAFVPAAAQDRVLDRASLGDDSLFGPGVVDLSTGGRSAKLRLARPAHLAAFAITPPAVVRLTLPRAPESRRARAGDHWVDLPAGVETRGRVVFVAPGARPAGARSDLPSRAVTPDVPPEEGIVLLVIAADSAWSREAMVPLLPARLEGTLMEMASQLAVALTQARTDRWAAYVVRWQ